MIGSGAQQHRDRMYEKPPQPRYKLAEHNTERVGTMSCRMNIVELPVPNLPPDLIARFAAIVGDRYAVTAPSEIAPYLTEERGLYHGRSPQPLC